MLDRMYGAPKLHLRRLRGTKSAGTTFVVIPASAAGITVNDCGFRWIGSYQREQLCLGVEFCLFHEFCHPKPVPSVEGHLLWQAVD